MDQPSMKFARMGVVAGTVGLICCIVSTALDYWFYKKEEPDIPKIYFGLWELCYSGKGINDCTSWSKVEDASQGQADMKWLHACQAFMIIADLFLGLGVVLGALFAIQYKSYKRIQWAAGFLCIGAGICALIAVIVFGAKYKEGMDEWDQISGTYLHAGFGLAIVAALLAGAGGFLVLMNKTIFTSSYP